MAKILLNIRIDEALRERLKVLAAAQNRTLSNLVETELKRVADAGDGGRFTGSVADILKVFVSEVAEALDGKTADEIAASPVLARDAAWLKRARDALARAGEG